MSRHPLTFAVVAGACALACLAGCGPKLVIVKAVYGALPDGATMDVTDQVAAMVKDNTLRVDASNEVFGDPADGAFKRLRVDYTVDGVAGSKTVGEDATLTLPFDEQPLVGQLVIVKAVYGDLAGGQTLDVTAQVAALVKDNSLTVVASNEAFDDPAPGVWKRLRVEYTVGGVPRHRTVGEDRKLTLSGNPR